MKEETIKKIITKGEEILMDVLKKADETGMSAKNRDWLIEPIFDKIEEQMLELCEIMK